MKTLCTVAALVACATAAQAADAWTCAYVFPVQPVLMRFTVAPPNVTEVKSGDVYRILLDNEYGLIAARGNAEIKKGEQGETAGAATIVILKRTGEFRYVTLTLGVGELATSQTPMRGICIKD